MKPIKTKQQQRQELEDAISTYLEHGGEVNEVPRGVSGREDHNRPLPHVFDKKADTDTRTPVNEVVAAIEQRRRPQGISAINQRRSRPRKKIIYDDFGQPLRWEWERSD